MKQSNGMWRLCTRYVTAILFTLGLATGAQASEHDGGNFDIDDASWSNYRDRLSANGSCSNNDYTVTITNADSGAHVGNADCSDGRWYERQSYEHTSSVPCRIRAEQSNGAVDERDVSNAPSDCDDGGGGTPPPGDEFPKQTDFKIMMNYELGMHCTGFEFAYCCVLPVYNSILAQVVKPEGASPFPALLEGDPNEGLDILHRETVLRDPTELERRDGQDVFRKYVLRYWHEAQSRSDGRGAPQGPNRLISAVEGNSLLAWNTLAYPALEDGNNKIVTGGYEGAYGVVQPDKDNPSNYQNVVWNHLYIHDGLEGAGGNPGGPVPETSKVRLGLDIVYPENCGPALHPMGPGNPDVGVDDYDCGGASNGNVLTYSGENGTIVYTQMKVLEDLPVYLTSPRIWEALGLPLTPFEDTIGFFDPEKVGLLTEETVRPYVRMMAQLYDFHSGEPVLDSRGDPVIGFGTAPIDIPNCERCHANAPETANSPNTLDGQWDLVTDEYAYWMNQTGNDWYSRLKSAAVSMLYAHDVQHGTGFMDCYPYSGGGGDCDTLPDTGFLQTTRLGKESVICQKCHADNVIAVVKSAYCTNDEEDENHNPLCSDKDALIPPVTDAIHHNHRNETEGGPIVFHDSLGRDGGCQGCHPAHRSDGDLAGYPITEDGENYYFANGGGDNRLANGGCFVGRDVHSNIYKDGDPSDPVHARDGAGTPSHLNAVGEWLMTNVANDQGDWRGIWCTNCHSQLSQEMWKAENCRDLIHGDCESGQNPRGAGSLGGVAAAVGTSLDQAESWLDPKTFGRFVAGEQVDDTHAIWEPDPGLCAHAASLLGLADPLPATDGNVATVEINLISAENCTTGEAVEGPDCFGFDAPSFYICGTFEDEADGGDFNVALRGNDLSDSGPLGGVFCTTPDCVAAAGEGLDGGFHYDPDVPDPNNLVVEGLGQLAVPVPFSAATDGRDHWLAAGEPHCADCHEAPYVEPSGHIENVSAFAPFNYPRKASLMRYSRGHQDISCQGCHESIHGLYPVTPTVDTTTYAQAASLNHDGTHGPLKCGTCHEVNSNGVPRRIEDLRFQGQEIRSNYDLAVGWAHTFTMDHDPTQDYCRNCHGDESNEVSWSEEEWLEHSMKGRVPRKIMDRVEIQEQGFISGDPERQDPLRTVCRGCHGDESDEISCTGEDGREWKEHLIEGRVSQKVWVYVSENSRRTGNTTCGW